MPAYSESTEMGTELGRLGGTPHGGGHGQECLWGRLKRSCLGMGRVVVSQTCQDFPPPPGAGPHQL